VWNLANYSDPKSWITFLVDPNHAGTRMVAVCNTAEVAVVATRSIVITVMSACWPNCLAVSAMTAAGCVKISRPRSKPWQVSWSLCVERTANWSRPRLTVDVGVPQAAVSQLLRHICVEIFLLRIVRACRSGSSASSCSANLASSLYPPPTPRVPEVFSATIVPNDLRPECCCGSQKTTYGFRRE
jgi:hypothetical protein